jgi:dephospho-CoA kinase
LQIGSQIDVDNQPGALLWLYPDKRAKMRTSRRLIVQVIGLTGGIATGKSTVSAILENAGAVIIDADRIARKVVKKNLPAYRQIVAAFGKSVLLPNEEIDRTALGNIIFNDPRKKQLLNTIVHPRVLKETKRQLKDIEQNKPNALVVLDIPLLFEAGTHKDLSEVIVVYVPEPIQIKRLMERDRISQEDALTRIRSQMPIEEKKSLATMVIDNSDTLEHTRRQTLEILQRLKKQSL